MATLSGEIKNALENFDSLPPEEIVGFLNEIKSGFRTDITRNYLEDKIARLAEIHDTKERSKYCKQFRPYFEWYLNGN